MVNGANVCVNSLFFVGSIVECFGGFIPFWKLVLTIQAFGMDNGHVFILHSNKAQHMAHTLSTNYDHVFV